MRISLTTFILLCFQMIMAQDTTAVKVSDSDSIYLKVDSSATTDKRVWQHYIEHSLQVVLEDAASRGMKDGIYELPVQFVVEKDGSLSSPTLLKNDPGFRLAAYLDKMFSKAPKWTPAQKNGTVVRSYHTQPFTFVISSNGRPLKKLKKQN